MAEIADFPLKCGLCNEDVGPDDYYRELDCTRNCEHNVHHENCIEKYLRKHGRGGEQKTGFACPTILPNGKACVGKVKRTHARIPINIKKKELNRQAAVAVNVVVNSARVASKAKEIVNPLSKKDASGGIKLVKTQQLTAQTFAAVKVLGTAAGRGDLTLADDVTHLRQKGKKSVQRTDDDTGSESNFGEPIRLRKHSIESEFVVQAPRQQQSNNKTSATQDRYAPKAGGVALAVSKNSAMAPSPMVRQRVMPPGWTGPVKTSTSASSLQQQRELVAALRAKEKFGSANRASNAAPEVAETSAGKGASAASDDGWMAQASERPWKPSGEPSGDKPWLASATADQDKDFPELVASFDGAKASHGAAADAVNFAASTVPTTLAAGSKQNGHQMQLRRSSSYGEDVGSPATMSLTASPGTGGEPASPASTSVAYGTIGAQDAEDEDPIVDYDQLFATQEGTVVVQDAETGLFFRVEDVYGANPEMVGFEDEAGNVSYYVVVRASSLASRQVVKQHQQLLLEQRLQQEESDAGAVPVNQPAGMELLAGQSAPTDGVPEELEMAAAEEENDFDDLLALCLGN